MYNQFKKSIAVVLALLTVLSMSMFSTAATATITGQPCFDGKDCLDAKFGRVTNLWIQNNGTLKIDGDISSPKDIAVVVDNSVVSNLFSFGLVTQDTINFGSNSITINGSAHSNSDVVLGTSSGRATINGTLEAVGTVTVTNGQSIPKKDGVGSVDLPDVKLESTSRNVLIEGNKNITDTGTSASNLKELDYSRNSRVGLSYSAGKYSTYGNAFILDTADTTLDFKGAFNVSNGLSLNGEKQYIIADGDIYIGGGTCYAKDAVIYSRNGNVTIATGTTTFTGVIYAPNGQVKIQGNNTIVNGSIASESVDFGSGDITITHKETTATKESSEAASRAILDKAKGFVNGLLDKVENKDVRMAVIPCNTSADNTNPYMLYTTTGGSIADRAALDTSIKDIPLSGNTDFNLGDGLRRAYHLLYNSSTNTTPKYIIVLGYNAPNVYTINNDGSYQTDNQDSRRKVHDSTDTTTSGAIYAREISKTINAAKMDIKVSSGSAIVTKTINAIYPVFINYTGNGNSDPAFTSLNAIAGTKGCQLLTDVAYNNVLESVENTFYTGVGQFTSVVYKFKLPVNAVLVNDYGNMTDVASYSVDSDNNVTVTSNAITLSYCEGKDQIADGKTYRSYSFNYELKLRVKFVRSSAYKLGNGKYKGYITFSPSDALVQYMFDYIDSSNTAKTYYSSGTPGIKVNFSGGCTYTVTGGVDIG